MARPCWEKRKERKEQKEKGEEKERKRETKRNLRKGEITFLVVSDIPETLGQGKKTIGVWWVWGCRWWEKILALPKQLTTWRSLPHLPSPQDHWQLPPDYRSTGLSGVSRKQSSNWGQRHQGVAWPLTCAPSTWELKAEGSGVWGHTRLQMKAAMGNTMRPNWKYIILKRKRGKHFKRLTLWTQNSHMNLNWSQWFPSRRSRWAKHLLWFVSNGGLDRFQAALIKL